MAFIMLSFTVKDGFGMAFIVPLLSLKDGFGIFS